MSPVSRKAVEAITELNRENDPIGGRLGIPIDGIRQVNVANRPGFVYVRLRDNSNELVQAFNESVSPVYDLPVLVEFKNNRYVVIGRDTDRYSSWGSDSSYLPAHASQHSMLANQLGGGDPVFVDGRQMMPGAAYPSGTLGGPNVLISDFLFRNKIGNWLYIGNTGTPDLNTLRPNGSTARMVLVCLDYTSGGFVILTGSTFSATLTGTSQIWPYVPNNNLDQVPLAAIRIVSGTTSIGWDNIYDARQWIDSGFPTGSSGAGVTDGDKGDITVSGAGTVWTIDNGAVTYPKIQDVSSGDRLLGRITGSGVVEEIVLTAAGRALLDDATAADQRSTLGFEPAVLATLLDGLNLNNDQSIADANSLLQAFGRLQAQINNLNDGWLTSPFGWEFSSADSPSFIVNITSTTVTGTVGVGDKIKFSHLGQQKFFVVTKIGSLVSGTYYPYTLYGGTDYTLTTGTISSIKYSHVKNPFGFPQSIDKWTVKITDSTLRTQTIPNAGQWYNLGGQNIVIPIGLWKVGYTVLATSDRLSGNLDINTSFSTSTGTPSDPTMNRKIASRPSQTYLEASLQAEREIELSSKGTYYIITMTAQSSVTNIYNNNAAQNLVLYAACSYI